MGRPAIRRLRNLAACLLVSAWATSGATSGAATALDRTEKHPEHGFSLDRPSSFEARPVPPNSSSLLLVFAPRDAPVDRAAPVTHEVHRIPIQGDGPLAVKRWILDTFRPSKLESARAVRARFGREPVRFEGERIDDEGVERSLFVHGWLGGDDAIVFVGQCEEDLWRRERRVFDRGAMSFRFFSEAEVDEDRRKWERHYRRSSLPHREERIDVASALVDGWQIKDTPHSVILYHGDANTLLMEQVARNLIGVRRQFALDFPPDRPIDGLSVVRICRDRGEYLTYGGNPSTVGYFSPSSHELVLYDAREDRVEPMPDDHPTMRTLYHEACHQFLYHTASALSPHSWYDEGTAEYYAGSVLEDGTVRGIVGLEGRERFLRSPDAWRRKPALADLLSMSQEEFYADGDVNYSMGYAFVRFLRTSLAAKSHPRWAAIPGTYFESLRTTWREEAEALVLGGMSAVKYRAAIDASRAAALAAALDGIDLPELETAFLEWVRQGAR